MNRSRLRVLRSMAVAALLVAACGGSGSPTGTPAGGGGGGGGSQSSGPAAGGDIKSIKACALLTKDEIKQALDTTVGDGLEQDTDTQVECQWEPADNGDGASVSVSVAIYDDVIWQTFSKAEAAKPVSGLGDAAFSGYPHDGDISIRKGGYQIDIGIVDFRTNQDRVHTADTTFANLVLSRL